MMPYDFYIQGGVGLDTRQAHQAKINLDQELHNLQSSKLSIQVDSSAILQANKDILQLQSHLNAAMNPTRHTLDLSMFQTQLDKTKDSMVGYAKSLKAYGSDGQQSFLALTKTIAAAEAPTTRLSQGLKNAGEQFKRTIGWQLSSSAIHGVMSTYSQAINYAKELNRSLTDIRIVTGKSQEQMANFARYANTAAKGLSSTTTRYTDAALIYYQQGLSEKAVKDRTDVTIKMANVAGVSAEKASQQLTAIWNNFDNGSKSLEHYADVLVKLGAETASSSDEISKGVQKFAAIGNTVGLSYEYAASALATVTATTRESADTVGTSFRTLFSRLQGLSLGQTLEDGTTLNKYSKALDTIGVRIKETNGEMKAMDTILDEIGAKWKTLSKDTQIGLAQSVGGARQYASFMALMDNWDYFQENVGRANNAAGALQKQQEIYAESWDASSKRVRASMEAIFDSAINDKVVIALNNGLAGTLDIVNSLQKGFGGLGGVMGAVSSIALSRYAKELPRVWDDVKYNAAYIFKPNSITQKQESLFKDSYAGLDELRKQNGMEFDEVNKKWIDGENTDAVLKAQIDNASEELRRREDYLKVEKTLSQREKAAYQQQMAMAGMWDKRVLDQAQVVQNNANVVRSVKNDIAEESYQDFKQSRDQWTRSYYTTDVNNNRTLKSLYLKDENSVNEYYQDRMANIQSKYNAAQQRLVDDVGGNINDANATAAFDRLERERVAEQTKASSEMAQLKQDIQARDTSVGMNDDLRDILGEDAAERFVQAQQNYLNTGSMSYSDQQTIIESYKNLQKPVEAVGRQMGRLDRETNAFSAALKNGTLEVKEGSEAYDKAVGKIDSAYEGLLKTAADNNVKINTETLNKAHQEYKDAIKGGNKEQIDEVTQKFQREYQKVQDAVNDKVEKGGMSQERSADIANRARQLGASEADQKSLEDQRKEQAEKDAIQHQVQQAEIFGKAASTAMMAATALQSSSNLYDTIKNGGSALDIGIGALSTVGSWGMLGGSINSLGTALGGTVGGTGFASMLAGPGGFIASAIITALPLIFKGISDLYESPKEAEARYQESVTNAEERAQLIAIQRDNFESQIDSYNEKLAKFNTASSGYEQEKARNALAQESLSLISDYNLSSDQYRWQEDGTLRINQDTIDEIQDNLVDQEKNAINQSVAITAYESIRKDKYGDLTTQEGIDSYIKKNYFELEDDGSGNSVKYVTDENGHITGVATTTTQTDEDGNQYQVTTTRSSQEIIESENFAKAVQQQNEAKNNYQLALNQIASSDGSLSDKDAEAISYLSSGVDFQNLKTGLDAVDKKYGGVAHFYTSYANVVRNAEKVMGEEGFEAFKQTDAYKQALEAAGGDENATAMKQFIMDATRDEALNQELQYQLDAVKEDLNIISEQEKLDFKNQNFAEAKLQIKNAQAVVESLNEQLAATDITEEERANLQSQLMNAQIQESYYRSQYNTATTDLMKAIGAYTDYAINEEQLINGNLSMGDAQNLAQMMQDFGDTFGEDAAKSIYDATIEASGRDRKVLLDNLKEIDFSGSNINTLNQMYDLSEDLGGKFTEVFEDVKKSFGGDAGIFKEIANDKSIQKMLSNFEKLGDIDAESIVKATHSSADLAMAMEMAGFNAGGLAAALEGVASGTIKEEQVTNSLLAGLSVLNQVDSIRAEAYDSIDTYDKGRSVTEYGKFTGNLAKTIQYNLRNGYMFDETLMNAWGELFGEDRVYELQQDFINWQSGDKKDISKAFNEKYKDEKEFLEAIQKNPYDLSAQWKYAFKRSDVDIDEHYNDVWVGSNDTEKDKDTDNISFNTVGEEEYQNAYNLLRGPNSWALRGQASDLEIEAAEKVLAQADKEKALKDKYVNINGAIYEVGEGKGQVQWKDGKWISLDEEGNEVKPNVDNALFGWNSKTGQVSFNKGFEESDMTLDEMRDYIAYGMGMGENSADRMIADLMAQNTTMQKKFGDSQVNEAVNQMTKVALDNDEWITQDQMETMFQSSNYLKNKYEGGETEGWMADYLSGKDIERKSISREDYNSAEEFLAAVREENAAYNAKMAERAEFQKRYISFGNTDLRTATFEEADAALKKATGMGTIDRLQSKKVKVDNLVYDPHSKEMVNEALTKDGYDMSDTMQQLLAMGYSQTQAYEAMGKIMEDGNSVLIETVRDVDGNVQTFSSDSKAYQQWATQHGIEDAEQNAEAFDNFIQEQDAVAKAVQQMAVEAQARAQYEAMYNPDGTRKTDENGNPINPDGTPEGDTEVVEDETIEVPEGQKPDGTVEVPTTQPNEVGTTDGPGKGGGDPLLEAIDNGSIQYDKEKGTFYDPNMPTWREGETTREYIDRYNRYMEENPDIQDLVNQANDEVNRQAGREAIGRASGQNQDKIKKRYAKGRKRTEPYEGLAQVGEVGPELSIDKDGNMTMLGVDGPTYAYVEKDDIIFTADETKDILKTTPNLNNIPGFEWGIGDSNNIVSSAYGNDNIWNGDKGSGGSSGGGGDDDWEPDRYVVIMEQLQDLQREYARLVKAKERAFGADKIKAIDAEISKVNELTKAQKAYISEIEQYKQKDLQKLKDLGIDVDTEFVFDRNGVIRNFDEISEKYKKAAEEGNREAGKQYEAIMKFMETNNLLEQQMDALIDMQWQLMDLQIERITTKVDIKVAVDDTDLQYLSYQLGKINEEAYDVAKALTIVGDSIEVNLNKVNAYRQGLGETLQAAFNEIGLDENAQNELLDKIEQGTLTQEDLDNFEISPDHSANIMNVLLDYRQQLITVNQQLDQLRDQVTDLVVRHFTDFTKDVGEQTNLINTYTNTLQTYANLTELLNGRFQGNMDKILTDINSSISKNAKDSIKNTELLVQAAEIKYAELNEMYLAASRLGDQATMDKVADARDTAYKELQDANNKYASAWMSANEAFLNEFKFGINQAIENFQEQLSPLFGTIDQLSAAFERQNGLNDQYVDDYEKYYELNKMNRDLQTAIDETDNVNTKKALMKMQEEINKAKASENKLSEYDLEVLKNKVELEKARLALDEAKNAKSTVTLSRDQNGNWGYIYTAEEDKVAKAEQDYEDKLYQYQKANKEYLDDLQSMVIEAQSNMVSALAELDVNDPHYEEQRKSIIDSYMQTVAYVKEQMTSALGNQEDSRLVALERYDISMINLKNNFEDLSLSFATGEKNLENYFATLENSMPTLLAQLNELEDKYEANIADINNYVTGNKNIGDYMNENMDTLVNKSEEANKKIHGLYDTMVDELADVNKEVADIYNNWLPHIMDMTEKNEILAESISKIQHELSDLSEVEVPPVLTGEAWEHPEGYTENDYGVIRKLTEDEIKLREEIANEIKTDDKGVITNYDELKQNWYQEPPKEGEEDTRDEKLTAKWNLLQKLIGYGVYGDPNAKQTIGLTGVWETIQSNAAAMYNAAVAVAQGFTGAKMVIEQDVAISAVFPNVTDRNEIEEALNNLINDAAQYANRRS